MRTETTLYGQNCDGFAPAAVTYGRRMRIIVACALHSAPSYSYGYRILGPKVKQSNYYFLSFFHTFACLH